MPIAGLLHDSFCLGNRNRSHTGPLESIKGSKTIRLVSPEDYLTRGYGSVRTRRPLRRSLQHHNWEASGWRRALGLTRSTQMCDPLADATRIGFALGVDADSKGAVRS